MTRNSKVSLHNTRVMWSLSIEHSFAHIEKHNNNNFEMRWDQRMDNPFTNIDVNKFTYASNVAQLIMTRTENRVHMTDYLILSHAFFRNCQVISDFPYFQSHQYKVWSEPIMCIASNTAFMSCSRDSKTWWVMVSNTAKISNINRTIAEPSFWNRKFELLVSIECKGW